MKRGRVLVVDDQIELAENIAEILESVGFRTEVAASAEAAIVRVRQGGISALITDFKLGGRTGAELIDELRRAGERIPALVMSAYTDDGTIHASHAAGAWLFLPKPVPLETLLQVFDTLAEVPAAALLLDDETGLTDNLAEALAAAGHEVVVSRTAAEALAQGRRIEAAVVDYRLPDGTGVEVAKRLRARDPAIRLLFISGYLSELQAQLSQDLAGAETMEKPLNVGRVISWIELAPSANKASGV
jgi:DNA-binding NtrC family response regulator